MDLDPLLRRQDGVVSRSQVLAHGHNDDDIARMLRRREWARVFTGVYIDHTGPLSWRQRAWAATLLHAPAALAGPSALSAWGARLPVADEVVHLIVGVQRRVCDPVGVTTTRSRHWERLVHPQAAPPRMRLEPAALVTASFAGDGDSVVAVLADVVQTRRTTASRLLRALEDLPRLPGRRFVAEVLADVSAGAMSPLERRYLRDVERAHGLPRGLRQHRVRAVAGVHVRDVDYVEHRLIVELDGRLGHDRAAERWADLDRDIGNLVLGSTTVRVGWRQVLQPCRLADKLARLLAVRGWPQHPHRCGPRCQLH